MKEKLKEFIKEEYKFLIFLLVLFIVFSVKIPYYIMAPGGTINVTDRIQMEGYENTSGSLNMLYVSEYDATLATFAWAKLLGYDTYPSSDRQIADESTKEIKKRNQILRDNSLDIATLVAYEKASKKIEVKSQKNVVVATVSDNEFEVGDVIIKVDNVTISSLDEIRSIIKAKPVGEEINFLIERDGKEKNITSKVYMEDNSKAVGIVVVTYYDYDLDPPIDIKFKDSESGPSGGLMLTLTIYNAISDEDIIKGRNIAGTGTIAQDGTVGEIDGIKYKIMGAAKENIDIVFVPSNNYDEAVRTKEKYHYDMEIVKVSNVDDALSYLRK